jgi:ubiquinone/menaquinone biosynthesis C-methylase UbiE
MVSLARKRLQPWPERAHVHQSDGSFRIHQPDRSFDRFVSNYVFDLLAPGFAEQLLLEARRILMPGGKLCLVSLTHGASWISRAVSCCWQSLWRLSPAIVGGCHPIELTEYLSSKEWNVEHQARLIRWGLTSEVLVVFAR